MKDDVFYDPLIDVYALGLLVYELVTGKVSYLELGKVSPFNVSSLTFFRLNNNFFYHIYLFLSLHNKILFFNTVF